MPNVTSTCVILHDLLHHISKMMRTCVKVHGFRGFYVSRSCVCVCVLEGGGLLEMGSSTLNLSKKKILQCNWTTIEVPHHSNCDLKVGGPVMGTSKARFK